MWNNPSIQLQSGLAGRSAGSPASEQNTPTQQEAEKKRICIVSGLQSPILKKGIACASSTFGASITDKMEEQQKIKNRQASAESHKKRQEALDRAVEQFQKDNLLYSSYCSTPVVQLPKKPKPEDYLNSANIKRILAKPDFAGKIQNIDLDALVQLVLYAFPVTLNKKRDKAFKEKVNDLLGASMTKPDIIRFLKYMRKNVRSHASVDAFRVHQQQIFDICGQMRSNVQQLSKQSQTFPAEPTLEAAPAPEQKPFGSSLPASVPVIEPPVPKTPMPDIDPVDTSETIQRPINELLAGDITHLYPLLQKKRGYYLADGLPYSRFMLPQTTRNQLISDELKKQLSMKAYWGTGRYFELAPASDTESFAELMKQAKSDSLVSSYQPLGMAQRNATDNNPVLTWQASAAGSKKTPKFQVALYKVSEGDQQKTLALYNTHASKPIHIAIGKQNKFVLKARRGVFMQPLAGEHKKSMEWHPVTEYRVGRCREEETNPLIRDVPPPVEPISGDPAHWNKEGEYFLLPEMVNDLAGQKNRLGEKTAVCYNTRDIRQALKETFGKCGDKNGATSFIFYDRSMNHTIAVRVLRKDNKALVYIHESIDPDSGAAKAIREEILNAVRPFFKGSTLSFLAPGFTSQVDFSSCGVFAYKAIRAFDKHPALDEWLWEKGRQDVRILHQANEYNHRIKLDDLPLGSCLVPLNEMKAQLLKCYQGDEQFLTPEQLAEVVSHKRQQTLGQYLMAHQPFQALLNGSKANLSAIGKRYKYLMQWQELLLNKSMPSDPGLVQRMLVTGDQLTQEEYQLVTRFHPIINAGERDDANAWLATHMPEVAGVEESDWDMNCVFEDFAFGKQAISLADAKSLDAWLEQALNHPDDKHHQLMQAWCIYIKQSRASRFRNFPLRDIRDALRDSISALPKPVAEVAGMKRSSFSREDLPIMSGIKRARVQPPVEEESPENSPESEDKLQPVAGIKCERDEDFKKPGTFKKAQRGRKKSNMSEVEWRAHHNSLEMARRQAERDGFKALAVVLEGEVITKNQILDKAKEQIERLQCKEEADLALLEKLREKRAALEQRLEKLIAERPLFQKPTDAD